MKNFPVDIYSILDYGLEKWAEEFFWPVSDLEFSGLYTDIEKMFKNHVNAHQDETVAGLLLIQYKLIIEYANFIHALWVVKRLEKSGHRLFISPHGQTFYRGIIEGYSPEYELKRTVIPSETSWKRFILKAKDYGRDISLNGKIPVLSGGDSVKVLGWTTDIMAEYIRKQYRWVSIVRDFEWVKHGTVSGVPDKLREKLVLTAEELIFRIQTIAGAHGLSLGKKETEYLRALTFNRLMLTAEAYTLVEKRAKEIRLKELLIGGTGGYLRRIISLVLQKRGVPVTGFTHGSYGGWLRCNVRVASDFSVLNRYVTYTKKSAELFEKIIEWDTPWRNHQVEIVSSESPIYFNRWKQYRKYPLPKKIQKVMIIGLTFRDDRKQQEVFDLPVLHLNLRLISMLKKNGYKVIYKSHPDGPFGGQNIPFLGNDVETAFRPFEEVLDSADAYLFPYIGTSTFGWALPTNKPMIVMEYKHKEWNGESGELLKKRCRMVPMDYDDRGWLVFDEKQLLDALSQPPAPADTGFLEKYLFPENIR